VVRYAFADRPNDNILTLCESYLKELEALVKDDQANPSVTP
jgi:hypothetical protein